MNNNNDNKQYSAADIRRYLNGQMPVGEMNALEKAAIEDPFLAEAIEGYGNKAEWRDGDLDDLHARLEKRTAVTHKKIVPFYRSQWWKIAALVVVLAGSGTLIYYLAANRDNRSTIVAKNNVAESKAAVPDSSAAEEFRAAAAAPPAGNKSEDMQALAAPSKKQEPVKKPVTPGPLPEATAVMDRVKMKSVEIPEEKDSVKDAATEKRLQKNTDSLYPGAVAGRRSDGYANNTRQVEVVTSSAPLPRREVFITRDARPVNGTDSLVNYIEKNKRVPDSLKNMHGEVEVSFFVGKDGNLGEFNIEKSLNKPLDDEAIRLIKEGPVWKVLNNRKAKAVVTVRF